MKGNDPDVFLSEDAAQNMICGAGSGREKANAVPEAGEGEDSRKPLNFHTRPRGTILPDSTGQKACQQRQT